MKSFYALKLFKEYLKNKNYSENTVQRYERDVRYFLIFSGKEDVRDMSREDIMAYWGEIASCGRYTPESRRGIMTTLGMFFKFLLRNESILLNPFFCLDFSMKRREKKRLSVDACKLAEFLDCISGVNYADLRDRAVFELMYGTGIRVGEAVRLNVTDVDFNEGKLFVSQGKGKKDRVVPVGEKALLALKRYVDKGRNYLTKVKDREALFLTVQGARLKVNNIEQVLSKRFRERFPDEKICPHMLRHSFATHMLEAGAGIKQIKDILGHSSMQSTTVYTHFNVKSLKKILKLYHPRENELYEEVDEEEVLKNIER